MSASNTQKPARSRTSWWRLPKQLMRGAMSPRVRGTLRVGVYLGVVSMIGAGLAARSAWGSVSEQALVTGRQLAKLAEFTDAPERLVLNGQPIQIASAVSSLSVEEVLNRFEGVCREDGTIPRDLREVKGLLDNKEFVERAKKGNFGILRQQTKDDGVIACAVKNPQNGQRPTWESLGKFAESWDLADVGFLRYAYAQRTESGNTLVLTAWTDGSFKVDAMTPADGADAPGSDSPNVPRPPSSVRFLSAAAEGRPHGVRIYQSQASAKDVLEGYSRDLLKSGWETIDTEHPESRYFSKNGVDVVLVAEQAGDRSVVSMVETRGF
jgi:hypothetical protein